MKWSQLKKRIEATFASSVFGRVEVWNTRYRGSHDSEGEAWLTIDKQRVWSMGTYSFFMKEGREATRLQLERGCTDFTEPEQRAGYHQAFDEARAIAARDGVFSKEQVNRALFDYLNLSIDDAAGSGNPVIRGFAMLDQRFGKRRLMELDDSGEHPLVSLLFRFRCVAEGIELKGNTPSPLDGDDSCS